MRCGSSAHYRPRWANRGHGTVKRVSVLTATCHDCLSLRWEGCTFVSQQGCFAETAEVGTGIPEGREGDVNLN